MYHWCANSIKIYGKKKQIQKIFDELNLREGKEIFTIFIHPDNFKDPHNPYLQNVNALKWNMNEDGSLSIDFITHNGPSSGLATLLHQEGFHVEIDYHEAGSCLVGKITNTVEKLYDYTQVMSLEELYKKVPKSLIEKWNLADIYKS